MFSFFNKREEEISVVFDVGNGSVGAALVHFSPDQAPTILYTHREPLTYMSHVTGKRLLSSMLKLLKSVGEHLAKEGLNNVKANFLGNHTIKHVYCVFSSPWYVSQTKVLKYEKPAPFVVTHGLVESLIQKEQEQFNQSLKDGKYEQYFGTQVRLLEKKIISTKLNGYDIAEPIGKQARELEITFYMSFVTEDIMAEVQKVLHSTFAFKNIEYHSYALASWTVARDMFPETHEFLFADISGEVTDVSITSKDVLMETASFPIGRACLLRRIVEEVGVTPEIALSLLTMNQSGTVEAKYAAKLREVIGKVGQEWFAEFTKVITGFQASYPIPKTVFVTADADMSHYFLDTLTCQTSPELNIPQNCFSVVYINADTMKMFNHFAPKSTPDSFLGIESIFVRKIIV